MATQSTFGKYKLIAELGHGGMADVFLAVASGPEGLGFSKLVVVKKLRPNLAEDPEFVAMLVEPRDRLVDQRPRRLTAADLFAARHTSDLEARPEVVLSLDHAQRGLGTASCGPDTLPQYRLPAGRYSLDFTISPSP